MKLKLFYILALICSISLFSSAKQKKGNCDSYYHCFSKEKKSIKQNLPKISAGMGFDLSPLNQLVFGI